MDRAPRSAPLRALGRPAPQGREWPKARRYLVEEYTELAVLPAATILPFCSRHWDQAVGLKDRLYSVGNPDGSLPGAQRQCSLLATQPP